VCCRRQGLTPGVERVLRAVARAHVQTATPVTIHTHAAGQHGPAILAAQQRGSRPVAGGARSQRRSCYIDWFAPGALDSLRDFHYLHISQDVVPYLLAHGVTQDQIDQMLERTPARILSGEAPG
jgi:predicted metal-dependent phosphotriesterase family hydrolase